MHAWLQSGFLLHAHEARSLNRPSITMLLRGISQLDFKLYCGWQIYKIHQHVFAIFAIFPESSPQKSYTIGLHLPNQDPGAMVGAVECTWLASIWTSCKDMTFKSTEGLQKIFSTAFGHSHSSNWYADSSSTSEDSPIQEKEKKTNLHRSNKPEACSCHSQFTRQVPSHQCA